MLFQNFQKAVTADNWFTLSRVDFTDRPVNRRRNSRFHLHRFRNDKRFTFLDFLPLRNKNVHDGTRQGSTNITDFIGIGFLLDTSF